MTSKFFLHTCHCHLVESFSVSVGQLSVCLRLLTITESFWTEPRTEPPKNNYQLQSLQLHYKKITSLNHWLTTSDGLPIYHESLNKIGYTLAGLSCPRIILLSFFRPVLIASSKYWISILDNGSFFSAPGPRIHKFPLLGTCWSSRFVLTCNSSWRRLRGECFNVMWSLYTTRDKSPECMLSRQHRTAGCSCNRHLFPTVLNFEETAVVANQPTSKSKQTKNNQSNTEQSFQSTTPPN